MKLDTTPKKTANEADHLRVQAQRFRNHHGFRPSHFGKPRGYYQRANVQKGKRK